MELRGLCPHSFRVLLLLLAAAWCLDAQVVLENEDLALSSPPPDYSLTAFAIFPPFSSAQRCVLDIQKDEVPPSSELAVTIGHEDMIQAGCRSLGELVSRLPDMELAALIVGLPAKADSEFFAVGNNLPEGLIVTRITHDAWLGLRGNGTPVEVSFSRSVGAFERLLLSPGWAAYRWITFSLYVLCSLYSLSQLVVTFQSFRERGTIRFVTFSAMLYLGLAHGTVFAMGPWNTTQAISRNLYNFFWWSGYLFAYCSYTFLLLAWLQVSSWEKRNKPGPLVRLFKGWNIFGMAYFAFMCLIYVIVPSFSRASPIHFVAFALLTFILPVILIVQAGIFFYAGNKLLRGLATGGSRRPILRKITIMTYGAIGGFFFLVITVGMFSINGSLGYWLASRILAVVGLTVCVVAIFACLSQFKFQISSFQLQSQTNSQSNPNISGNSHPLKEATSASFHAQGEVQVPAPA